MKRNQGQPSEGADLRSRAETQWSGMNPWSRLASDEEEARRLLHELQVHQIELELQNEELLRSQAALEEARDKYLDLYDRAPAGYLTLDAKGVIRQANQTMASMISTERHRLLDQSIYGFVEQERHGALLRHLNSVAKGCAQQNLETEFLKTDGTRLPIQMESSPRSPVGGEQGFRIVLVDISRLKAAERRLHQANEGLEEEVRIRTSDLIAANKALEEEIKEREEAARQLDRQKTELESKSKELERVNIAVEVLLHRSEEEREAMEGNIMQQVHKLLLPSLDLVLATRLEPAQRHRIETVAHYLKQITSSFAQKLGAPSLGLSTREIQVAGMIQRGMSSKDIADSLNMSLHTVSFHRRNIRRKLGISNTDTSLSTHLRKLV